MPLRVPPFHHEKHEDGGADEIDVSGLAGGYSSADLVADHPLLSGAELHNPKAHKTSHEPTGADEINDVDIGNTGVLLSAHAARHESGGADEVSVAVAVHGADKHTDVTRDLVLEFLPYTAGGGAFHTEGAYGGYGFESSATGICYLRGKVPDKFVSFIDCKVIWMGKEDTVGQDWRMRTRLIYSAVGEAYDIHSEAPGDQILDVTVLGKKYAQDCGFSFTDLAIGDWIYVQVQRKGMEADDTYDGRIYIESVLITYTAEQ